MEFIKKNIILITGISIPILMIIFVAGSIYLPGLFIRPKFNFLYVSGDGYYYQYQYFVQNEKLARNEIERFKGQTSPPEKDVQLYIYDVIRNESEEISFADAQNLKLNSNSISPDGFEVVYGSHSDSFFPFFFDSITDYNTRYIKGHNVSKKLNLKFSSHSYGNSFRFLGWIK